MKVTDPKGTVADLRGAAAVLRRRGWCQDTVQDDQGRVCALGALHAAVRENCQVQPYDSPWRLRQREGTVFLSETLGITHIPTWNDAPERTAEDVVSAFEQAAEKMEADL